MDNSGFDDFIRFAVAEDLGDGDHTSLACIPENAEGKAQFIIKDKGVVSGIEIARQLFHTIDPALNFQLMIADGASINYGDIPATVSGRVRSLLKTERLVLNLMQRMSGIATLTSHYVKAIEGLPAKVLDTRKTTPGMRFFEKMAVRHGGGMNHRFGLYDMIMVKDNHIDFAGGIGEAIEGVHQYLAKVGKKLAIAIEARSVEDVQKILTVGGTSRIMLDNFTIEATRVAVKLIDQKVETESSGGITLGNIRDYARCGVDFISVGALTHQYRSLDISFKAVEY